MRRCACCLFLISSYSHPYRAPSAHTHIRTPSAASAALRICRFQHIVVDYPKYTMDGLIWQDFFQTIWKPVGIMPLRICRTDRSIILQSEKAPLVQPRKFLASSVCAKGLMGSPDYDSSNNLVKMALPSGDYPSYT